MYYLKIIKFKISGRYTCKCIYLFFNRNLRKWVASQCEVDFEMGANSGGYTENRGSNSHHKKKSGQQVRERQKQQLQQYFAQQNQNEYQEYMQMKEGMKVISKGQRSGSESPKKDYYQNTRQQDDTYTSAPLYHILVILFVYLVTSSVAEWLERSVRVWEARVRFPAESNQRFQMGR